MLAFPFSDDVDETIIADDRAMSQLAVLGILLGSAFVLVAALAVFMLAGP